MKFSRKFLLPILAASLCLLNQCTPQQFPDNETVASSAFLPVSKNPRYATAGLIEISQVDPSIKIDLQYTRPTPHCPTPLYPNKFPALLRPETALRLKHANELVSQHGMRLLVWDAYRPPSAQWKLFITSGRNDKFVANPKHAPSQHSCGTAVDVTLAYPNGVPVAMPTGFDSFKPEAASNHINTDPIIRNNLKILQSAMSKAGFYSLPAEWWHYIDMHYKNYPKTIPLSALSYQHP